MLNDNFCSSPWFHIRINPSGYYCPCRWYPLQNNSEYHISNTSIKDYMNSQTMRSLRETMLAGESNELCVSCYYQDQKGKVSGRQRQLLKSGISVINFTKSFASSPHYNLFEHSYHNNGHTTSLPVDLQIDLGNTCNSSCIMCSPTYSSKVDTDYKVLSKLEPLLFPKYPASRGWAEDDALVNKFVSELVEIPNIRYIHFLGGETLYLKSFYKICNKLIEYGLSKDISIGTTTNCTMYTSELETIIRNFKQVHLGLSIESFHPINDYVRWPSQIAQIDSHISKFIKLREETKNIQLILRITPNLFTAYHLDTIFEFMLTNSITAESCNILYEPVWLRVELLPKHLVLDCVNKINQVIKKYNLTPNNTAVINRWSESLTESVIKDVIFEYKNLFEGLESSPEDIKLRPGMVKFIKAYESIRNNSILDYLPEYEEFLRSYGY